MGWLPRIFLSDFTSSLMGLCSGGQSLNFPYSQKTLMAGYEVCWYMRWFAARNQPTAWPFYGLVMQGSEIYLPTPNLTEPLPSVDRVG
jgi:hypothetical protein